ncbi:hypothetical protein LTR62_007113 [Meristemomyces frigidus]|uniref:GID complex catalytic subunit 2 n=1 Tax=Meristemomyces frigidus TaxID=1508187 RepID=A0AAN7TET7_9PEZI|nr:hypothetical protein LTR62_007113 [Meristemomyces frigidus]
MEALQQAHETLEGSANLSKALQDVDSLIALLTSTRDAIADGPDMAPLHMAKLKAPLKQSFDRIDDDLKEVNKGLNQYNKALKDKFKNSSLPTAGVGESSGLASQKNLVDRAIAMHLLREGKFEVASTFVKEVNAQAGQDREDGENVEVETRWVEDFAEQDDNDEMDEDEDGDLNEELYGELGKGHLQRKFSEMYRILDALRNQHNLTPAIDWARHHSAELDDRGSNLEFELSRLKFIELYTATQPSDPSSSILHALSYARTTFPTFTPRYERETAALITGLAYSPNLTTSPYGSQLLNESLWTTVSNLFTRDFTSLLNLPSTSPLSTAITAGGLALPILQKVERIMTATRGQWTSVNELPVETPLPSGFMFHSVFVCPVSKEQATDANPPMLLPCGHVIAKESLEGTARGKSRVKCPYCPMESRPGEARRLYI